MYRKTIAIDLAKNVFEVAIGDDAGRVLSRHRLNRAELSEFLINTPAALVVSEACGTAHYWGRFASGAGHAVKLLPVSASRFLAAVGEALEAPALPGVLKPVLLDVLAEIRELAVRMKALERALHQLTRDEPGVQLVRSTPGIGLLTSTALVAPVGEPRDFKRARQLAAWTGLTPKQTSSGERRRLGRMSKQGDPFCCVRV